MRATIRSAEFREVDVVSHEPIRPKQAHAMRQKIHIGLSNDLEFVEAPPLGATRLAVRLAEKLNANPFGGYGKSAIVRQRIVRKTALLRDPDPARSLLADDRERPRVDEVFFSGDVLGTACGVAMAAKARFLPSFRTHDYDCPRQDEKGDAERDDEQIENERPNLHREPS